MWGIATVRRRYLGTTDPDGLIKLTVPDTSKPPASVLHAIFQSSRRRRSGKKKLRPFSGSAGFIVWITLASPLYSELPPLSPSLYGKSHLPLSKMWSIVRKSKIPPKSSKEATPGIQLPRLLIFVCGTNGRSRGTLSYSFIAVGRQLTLGGFL